MCLEVYRNWVKLPATISCPGLLVYKRGSADQGYKTGGRLSAYATFTDIATHSVGVTSHNMGSVTALLEQLAVWTASCFSKNTLQCLEMYTTGCFFWLVLPRKVLSMELVPPNTEKWLSSSKRAIYLLKKVKVQVRACQTLIFLLTSSKKWRSDRLWHELSLF